AAQATIAQQKKTISTLMDSPEDAPEPDSNDFEGRSDVPKVMNVSRKISHYAAAFGYLLTGVMPTSQASTMDVSDLRREFGTYLSQNQNNLTIHRQIFSGFPSASEFRSVPAVTEYRAAQAQINSVVQKFKPKWTPKGNTKFTPITVKNYRHKINVTIIPADVLDSYLFHLYDESLSPVQMPITKYIWEQLIYPKILDDIELRMIFKGKYVENDSPDEATNPEDSMNGVITLLIEEKLSGATRVKFFDQEIDWVTATDAEVVKFINDYSDFVDEDDLGIKKIYASKFVKKRYQRAYEALYGSNHKVVGGLNKEAEVDFVEMEIVDLKGMKNVPVIFATVPGNMIKLRHKNEVPMIINKVLETHYGVDLVGEFWLGAGFEIAEFTYAYVPENYTDAQQGMSPSNQFPDGT